MKHNPIPYNSVRSFLLGHKPDRPVYFFSPQALEKAARAFQDGFPGLVTYAVKANDSDAVLSNLAAFGIGSFDVASPNEMSKTRRAVPNAVLHYNNPVRSGAEIDQAIEFGVKSFAIDHAGELQKLRKKIGNRAVGTEVSVRLKLPVSGAAYDFGDKFGADPEGAVRLLIAADAAGFDVAMCFHPGTQCADPNAWRTYIGTCAKVAKSAGVTIGRLNVGGGFPVDYGTGEVPDLADIFAKIDAEVSDAFGPDRPELLCEPGRALVAPAFALGARVKSRRENTIYLNEGIYGALSEMPILGAAKPLTVLSSSGEMEAGRQNDMVVYGPTCDSLDRIPGLVSLPDQIAEGDYIVFGNLGAYAQATSTNFNGYGATEVVLVSELH